jgi:hypothetical protein
MDVTQADEYDGSPGPVAAVAGENDMVPDDLRQVTEGVIAILGAGCR